MPWKILTAITELEAREMAVEAMVTYHMTMAETARLLSEVEAKQMQQLPALRFVNVQRLMTYMRAIDIMKIVPFVAPPETLKPIAGAMLVTPEEEEYFTKRFIPRKVLEVETMLRPETVRIEKRLEEVRKRLLSPTAITLTDHKEFCLLEKHLWTTLQADVKQVLEKLMLMTIAKQYWCELIPDLEALIKLMLQMYVPMFMGMPSMTNMISLRLSALTMQFLEGMNVAIYLSATHQAQAMKPKALLMCAQKRKLETKEISSGKRTLMWVPRKEALDVSEELSKEDMIEIMRDLKGKAMFSLMMKYAYGMPYRLRRWLARTYGLPENHKYIRFLHLTGIPIRRALWAYRRRRYSPESFTYFNRDMYIKLMKKYGARYRAGYSHF